MLERLRKGFEHKDAHNVVDEAFEKGQIEVFDSLKNHPHPAVSDRFYTYVFDLARKHPRSAIAAGIVVGTGIAFGIRQYRVHTHERSREKAKEEFETILSNPFSVSFKRTCQAGEIAIEEGRGEQFIANLCTVSTQYAEDKTDKDRSKKVASFWGSLNPYHPIFIEMLDSETRHPGHPKPFIQTKYQEMIDRMINGIKNTDPKLSQEIEQAISGKIKKRLINQTRI